MISDWNNEKIEKFLTETANNICESWQYDYDPIVVLNPKFKTTLGMCTPEIEIIELNEKFVKLNSSNIVLQILKHELVHLKYFGHRRDFKEECKRLELKIHPGKNSNIKL